MKYPIISLILGVALLAFAWMSVSSIPMRADEKWSKLPISEGANEPTYVASHTQIIADTMLLKNFYVGALGLIFVGSGLVSFTRIKVSP